LARRAERLHEITLYKASSDDWPAAIRALRPLSVNSRFLLDRRKCMKARFSMKLPRELVDRSSLPVGERSLSCRFLRFDCVGAHPARSAYIRFLLFSAVPGSSGRPAMGRTMSHLVRIKRAKT
jgi:hypothetical protein